LETSSLLTFFAGTSIAKGFTSYHLEDFDITPWNTADYRQALAWNIEQQFNILATICK
jgi:hypothetical protein